MTLGLNDDPFFSREGVLMVRRMPDDSVPYAYFEGAIPDVRQTAEIHRLGYGLYLNDLPAEHRALDVLDGFTRLTHLGLVADQARTRKIEKLSDLVELHLVTSSAEEIDYSGFLYLKSFSGVLKSNESVFESSSIEEIFLEETSGNSIPSLPDSLRKLSVVGARKVQRLSAAGGSPRLQELSIYGAPSFDVDSLTAFRTLRKVAFERVKLIKNAVALKNLRLRELGIINCGSIDDASVFRDVEFRYITVVGKLGEELRPYASTGVTTWEFLKRL